MRTFFHQTIAGPARGGRWQSKLCTDPKTFPGDSRCLSFETRVTRFAALRTGIGVRPHRFDLLFPLFRGPALSVSAAAPAAWQLLPGRRVRAGRGRVPTELRQRMPRVRSGPAGRRSADPGRTTRQCAGRATKAVDRASHLVRVPGPGGRARAVALGGQPAAADAAALPAQRRAASLI